MLLVFLLFSNKKGHKKELKDLEGVKLETKLESMIFMLNLTFRWI